MEALLEGMTQYEIRQLLGWGTFSMLFFAITVISSVWAYMNWKRKQVKLVKSGFDIETGDWLIIKDNREINYKKPRVQTYRVVTEDTKSFAVMGELGLIWWWYRDSLTPYAGNAEILGYGKSS